MSYAKLLCSALDGWMDGWMEGGRDIWLGWVGVDWVGLGHLVAIGFLRGENGWLDVCMYVCMYVDCFDGIRRRYSAWESAVDGRGRMREDG